MSADEDWTNFVTKAEVTGLVRQQKENVSSVATCLSLKPPYHSSIAMKAYPTGYTVPNFQRFDDRKGNPIGYVSRFIDVIGPFAHNSELCLKEFSKSLTNRVYIWYLHLKPGSIQYWDHLVTMFDTKFFCGETKFTLAELRPNQTKSRRRPWSHVKKISWKGSRLTWHSLISPN